jgi:primosomal protein N' (replication factor Y)
VNADNKQSADQRIRVVAATAVDQGYDYRVNRSAGILCGQYVRIPLGPRKLPGVVWDTDISNDADGYALSDLKPVDRVIDDLPPMPSGHRRFLSWIADYTLSPIGSVVKMAMPVRDVFDPPMVTYYQLNPDEDAWSGRMTDQRQSVVEVAHDGRARTASDLAKMAGCSPGVIRGMAEAGFLNKFDRPPSPGPKRVENPPNRLELTAAQEAAANSLISHVASQQFQPVLLDGVTGSGKTEVYFDAIEAAISNADGSTIENNNGDGGQALVLVPEIGLTNALIRRFERRFGFAPVEWHSGLTPAQRRDNWRAIVTGQARVVIGARSALMLPYPNLNLIVVDEEHDASYKQEDGVIYNARDMAVVYAHLHDICVVLVSATPSLETILNVRNGRYDRVHLPDRIGRATMPAISAIDLREEKLGRQRFIAEPLANEIEKNLAAGEQTLLFLNRRGYAPLRICRTCGHRINCPNCTAWLVEHKSSDQLLCHHCGYHEPMIDQLPDCERECEFAASGPGVERIAEEVGERFEQAESAILSSDILNHPGKRRRMFNRIRKGKIDILIGTQIIAKGHHFPLLTLVGVIDADLGLSGGDLRAGERTYQLLHQVSGRAGRADLPGRVILQTHMPDHRVIQALLSGDRDQFLAVEAAERRAADMPPFTRLAGVIISGKKEDQVTAAAKTMARAIPRYEPIQVLGPAPAPFYKLRERYRYRFLVRADKSENIQGYINTWLKRIKLPSAIRVQVDIDPYSFL